MWSIKLDNKKDIECRLSATVVSNDAEFLGVSRKRGVTDSPFSPSTSHSLLVAILIQRMDYACTAVL